MSHKDQVTLSFAAGLDKEGAKKEIIPKSVEGVNPLKVIFRGFHCQQILVEFQYLLVVKTSSECILGSSSVRS